MQLRHGNPRILLQDHNITAESTSAALRQRTHTLLAAAGPQRFTLMCVCVCVQAPGAVYTCFFVVKPPESTPTDVMETGFPTAANTSVHSSSDYFWWRFVTSESPSSISDLKI